MVEQLVGGESSLFIGVNTSRIEREAVGVAGDHELVWSYLARKSLREVGRCSGMVGG